MSIQKTFFAGIRWTGFSSLLSFALGLLQVVLLTRYLENFAWIAIAGVFVNIGIQIQNAGINTAIVQSNHLTRLQLSTAYWINLGFGGALFVISIGLAFILRWVYESSVLLPIFILYSLVFLIQAFVVQYKALLQKNFHFQVLSAAEGLGVVFGFAFSVTTALLGWGAYALVGGYVMRYLAEGIWILIFGRQAFIPVLEWDLQSVHPLIQFGGWHLAERLVTHFSSQIDTLLIGKLLGSEALGTYDVFKRVLVRPLNLLNDVFEKVTFPVFSKFQSDITTQKKLYLNLLNHLGAINFPLLVFLAIAAEPIIHLLFGAQWLEGVPVFRLLCAFCLLHFLLNPVDTLLLANGKIKFWLYANISFVPLQIFILTLSSSGGLAEVTLANVLVYSIFTLITYYWIVLPQIQSHFLEWMKSLSRSLLLTVLAALSLLPFSFFTQDVWLLLPMGLVFAVAYLLLTFFYNHDLIALIQKFINIKK